MPLLRLLGRRRVLPVLGAGRPQGARTAGSVPFIAVPPVPAFLAVALVGLSTGPIQSAARLADRL